VREVKSKVLVIATALMAVVMLATPLVACVNAKPTIATVEFRSETWGDLPNPNEKERMGVVGNSTNILMHRINIIGNPPLLDFDPPPGSPTVADALAARGGIELNITMGSNTYTLVGSVKQLLIHGMARPGKGVMDNEKAIITILENPGGGAPDGWCESTLELSLVFTRSGGGKILGNRGTGIFKNVQFRGAFTQAATALFVPPYGLAVYKVQWGIGEIMFP
jgi:hypothetical protein